jgi:anaphase-promoting complex subunit 8
MIFNPKSRAGEMLLSLSADAEIQRNGFIKKYVVDNTDPAYEFTQVFVEDQSNPVFNKIIVARNLFDLREFKKCTDLLKAYANDTNQQAAMFLYHYS